MQKEITVEMDLDECYRAAHIGLMRLFESIKNGAETYGLIYENDGYQVSCMGAVGEYAFKKWSGLGWDPKIGDFTPGDVADYYEIRSTSIKKPHNHLLMKKDDKDDRPYIAAYVGFTQTVLAGWIWGYQGKSPRLWRDPNTGRPCFMIKRRQLNPMSNLPELGTIPNEMV